MGVCSMRHEWKRKREEQRRVHSLPTLAGMCSPLRELLLDLSVVVIETALCQLL